MNRYYQPTYYANNPTPYPYPSNNYPMPVVNPAPLQPIYPAVPPYQTKQFLATTFGNKPEYIQIFLTLTHEDKLKLYMLMQEKKFYGKINDQSSYQRILKLIAEKMKNNPSFNSNKQPKLERVNSSEKKQKDLESKIDKICQITFEKLKITTFQKDVQKWEEDFGDFEESGQGDSKWAEDTDNYDFQSQHQASPNPKEKKQQYVGLLNDEKVRIQPLPFPVINGPVFNMFTFDPEMQRALTNQIGLKKEQEQKVSIWELKVDESQLKKDEPDIREVFHKKQEPIQYKFNRRKSQSESYKIAGVQKYKVYQLDTNPQTSSLNFNFKDIQPGVNADNKDPYSDLFDFNLPNAKQKQISQIESSQTHNMEGFSLKDLRQETKIIHLTQQDNILDFDFLTENIKPIGTAPNQPPSSGVQSNSLIKSMPLTINNNNQFDLLANYKTNQVQQNQPIIQNQLTNTQINQTNSQINQENTQVNQPNAQVYQASAQIEQKQQTEEQEQWEEAQEGQPPLQSSIIAPPVEVIQPIFDNQTPKNQQFQLNFINNPSQSINPKQNSPYDILQQNHYQNTTQNTEFGAIKATKAPQNLFDFDALYTIQQPIAQLEPAYNLIQPSSTIPSILPQQTQTPATQITAITSSKTQHQTLVQPSPPLAPPPIILPMATSFQKQQNAFNDPEVFAPDDQRRYDFLGKLNLTLKAADRQQIKKQLKNKSFECNWNFYSVILDFLKQLNMQDSPEHQHFMQQYKISKQIHELTQKYSQAVDEDEEETVFATIRQSKQLYNKIYNKSHLSQQYVQNILNNKYKAFIYKLAKILVDSNINRDIIERAISQQNTKDVENSLYVIYTLQKLNRLHHFRNYAEKVIKFLNQEYEKFKNLDQSQLQNVEKEAEKHPKFIIYIKGLLRVCAICQRMIQLSKISCIKIPINTVKTLKICKELKGKYSLYVQKEENQPIVQDYTQVIKKAVTNNQSPYDLHNSFVELVRRIPVCCFCLQDINRWGGQDNQKGYFHYCCYNLIKQIQSEQVY